ncbi:MAG: hypothetical protein AB7S54_10850 [Bacteroidales bacterium]
MNKKRYYALTFILGICFTNKAIAQYKINTEKMSGSEKIITYTPEYLATKKEMYTSAFSLSFQKIEGLYYIFLTYSAWQMSDFDPKKILSTTFTFKDGLELTVPTSFFFDRKEYDMSQYNIHWDYYYVRSGISKEQLELFTNKPMLSIAYNVDSVGRLDGFVTEKQRYYIAACATYFLTGEKVNKNILNNRFNSISYEAYNNEKWDY